MIMKIFRFVSGTAAALMLVTGLAAAQPAAARDRLSPGAAVALGALGGLAVGAAVGAAAAQPPVYAPAPAYVESETVYYRPGPPPPPPPVYVERCVTERFNEWVPGYGWEQRTR